MALSARQPFAEIGTPRLQALSSAKNRQNAISPNANFTSPLKPALQPSTGKRRATAVFEDDDSENLDPSIFNSPTKKSKTIDGLSKPSKFSLVASPSKPSFPLTASPPVPSVRKALSSPNTSNSTPINHSRGSPKHKRVGALSKRRASSSPFRRVDPPSFSQSSPALPFSIDAALSGTIPNYTPKSSVATPVATPVNVSTIEESMPKSWFFEIHEDTPEQEAANLMEHSAAILDISSDDDVETKRRNEELERGKENIPPSDVLASQPRMQQSADVMETNQEAEPAPVKRPRLRNLPQDAMDEDRKPLSDLAPADYYGEGLDATSYVTVDATLEKPSGLSKEFDFSCPTPEKKATQDIAPEAVPLPEETESSKANENIPIFSDESTTTNGIATVLPEEAAPAPEAASQPQETASTEP